MNIRKRPDEKAYRHEWQAQERALNEERRGVDPMDCDGDVAKYRLIARALRQPPIDSLPQDFAAQAAARIESMTSAANDRFEQWLQRVLFSLLFVAGTATAAIFGGEWLTRLVSRLPALEQPGASTAADWIFAVAICFTLSWTIEQWRRSRHPQRRV